MLLSLVLVCSAASDDKLGLHSDGGSWRFYPAKTFNGKLPNVLLIGDSILGGYRNHVIKGLKGKANVDIWLTPVHLNSKGLHEDLAKVAAHRKYAVIHFNIGLHGWPKGRIPEGKYSALLKAYVAILQEKAPGACLIWGTTTQVHAKGKQELNKEINPTIVSRNKMAAEVMKEMGVTVNDLYGLMSDKLHLVRGDRFHWKGPAYVIMAKQIVAAVEDALSKKRAAVGK